MKKFSKLSVFLAIGCVLLFENEAIAMETERNVSDTMAVAETMGETVLETDLEVLETITESKETLAYESESEEESELIGIESAEEIVVEEEREEVPISQAEKVYENKGVYDFVVRMYDEFLGREADVEGLDDWYNRLVNHEAEAANVVDGFVNSKEFQGMKLSTDEYLSVLYEGILGRKPDETGAADWANVLEAGVSQSYIPSKFVDSVEFTQLCEEYNVNKGTITLTENRDQDVTITEFVTHFYKNCLDREGDRIGLNDWTGGLLSHKMTGADISNGFLYSPEFLDKALNNEEFVAILYDTLLMREADAAGKEDWMNRMDNGVSDNYIISGFVHSKEFSGFCEDHKIKRGDIVLTEARDQNYELTSTVTQAYKAAKQKMPEAETLNEVIGKMLDGTVSAHEVIASYFNSEAYENQNKSNETFIKELYQIVLKRQPNADELKTAVDNIQKESKAFALDRIVIGKEFSEACLKYGVELMDYQGIPAMKYAKEILDELDWNLEDAFKWCYTGIRYQYTGAPAKGVSHTEYYGKYGFEKRVGNCYVMASAFYWMAKINGWDVYLVEGYVPTAAGYNAVHGWIEVEVGDEIYVCDPSGARKNLKAYMIKYGTPGSYRYLNYQRVD